MKSQVYPCLFIKQNALEMANYYCGIFRDTNIVTQNPMVVLVSIKGQQVMILNGNDSQSFNDTFSLVVNCDTQEEIDRYWDMLIANGGKESMCGWLKDKYGVSWQIVPSELGKWMSNPKTFPAVLDKVMKMKKLIIADMKAAAEQ